jgi:alpha-D-ribose 1-methylphosphonate 5-triphosphate synthase subunit PhnH
MIAGAVDLPAFVDPIGDAQTTFRAVLDAMSHPGRIYAVDTGLLPPSPLNRATAAVTLALIDHETTLCLDATMQAATPWIVFHTGSPIVADHRTADFVLASACPELSELKTGTDEEPETSATLILQIVALGNGKAYRLTGPGLAEPHILRATGLPGDFIGVWRGNHVLFPRGVDIIICAGDHLVALPRSVMLEAA